MSLKVSIIVPVYKAEKYIRDCLDSLLAQDYPDCEIILVDDGSPDASGNICDEYRKRYNQITVVHQKNAGVSAARNVGLGMASGDYLTFVDSDDWVDPDYVSLLVDHMQKGGMAACGYIGEKNAAHPEINLQVIQRKKLHISMDKERAELSVLNWKEMNSGCCGKIFDGKLLQQNKIQFQEGISHGEDHLFVMQYLACTEGPIIWIKEAAYHYRINPQGACGIYRRKLKEPFSMDHFSILKILEYDKKFVEATPRLRAALEADLVREKVAALQMIRYNGWTSEPCYKIYLHDIRKGLLFYLRNNDIGETMARKIGTVICALNPFIYHVVWKIYGGLKNINY